MVQAWMFKDGPESQYDPHKGADVSLTELAERGILYWCLDADHHDTDPELAKIRKERGYKNFDIITISPAMPNFEDKMKIFFDEHLHDDEEIRMVLDGSGYFDVRGTDEVW
eukprot:CAMPEP_0184655704 /NCGR_PEP_ID=MMETSP0308-20130426/14357_1 /TAXON_ID=38269 /ORGANISM="Gloeochaete witrockiana, Strain SAG 46.84" /LENGTH=110 /DNA_ID=CAMNT_0027092401 /DNA_START=137 /DNA_END=466 /DNA_ORIENTATION=+